MGRGAQRPQRPCDQTTEHRMTDRIGSMTPQATRLFGTPGLASSEPIGPGVDDDRLAERFRRARRA